MSKKNLPSPRRGEVWDVNFDPTIGAEIRKIRPAAVVSSDSVGCLPIKLVAPITGWQHHFSGNIWHVLIKPNATNGLTKESAVDALQIRAVAEERFIEKRGRLNPTLMEEITAAIVSVIEHE